MNPTSFSILGLLSRMVGMPRESLDLSLRLCDLLAGMPLPPVSSEDLHAPFDQSPGDVPDEIRLFLLATAIEDECGVDLVEHPEFESLWNGTVARLLDVAASLPRRELR